MSKRPRAPKAPIHALARSIRSLISEVDYACYKPNLPTVDVWVSLAGHIVSTVVAQIPGNPPFFKNCSDPSTLDSTSFMQDSTRALMLQCINFLNSNSWQQSLSVPTPCPNACPSRNPPAKPTCTEKSVWVVPTPLIPKLTTEQSVATDLAPVPTPPPPKTYANVLVKACAQSPVLSHHTPSTTFGALPATSVRARHQSNQSRSHALGPLHITSSSRDLVQFVIQFNGNAPSHLRTAPSTEPFRLLSLIQGVSILGAHWNKVGNLILSFPSGTPLAAVESHLTSICSVLCISSSVSISSTTPWSKILVSSVIARDIAGAPTYSETVLRESFLANPAISSLSVMRQPRWIRNPASITGQHSSFTLSFADPDGSLARTLVKTQLFVFGAPVTARLWIEPPRPRPKPKPATSPDAPMSE
ncbi:hypothetical protein FRC07_006138 [Ceratobasidium sp. 392]|nr:hypothetical protein FRC07_006138 [Ceratobasidium sp. 392]